MRSQNNSNIILHYLTFLKQMQKFLLKILEISKLNLVKVPTQKGTEIFMKNQNLLMISYAILSQITK